jgi:WD40 repeat protein
MTRARLVALCALLAGVGVRPLGAVDPPAAAPLRPTPVRLLAYSPDGNVLLASVGRRDQPGALVAWSTEARRELWVKRDPKGFSALSFAPDGKAVAVARGTTAALRLDPVTGKDLGEIGPHPAAVRAVAHIPGTDLLATGGDGTIRLWNVTTGKLETLLKDGHPAEVSALVASPDGKWLISTGPDGTRGWDVAAGAELKDAIKPDRSGSWYSTTFLAPDRILVGTNSGSSRIFELPSGRELMRFTSAGGYDGITYSARAGLAAYRWANAADAHIVDLTFRAPTADEKARIAKLLTEFDDDSYSVRVAASAAVREIGSVAEPALRRAMADGPSAEVKMRARETRKAILEEPLRALKGHTDRIGPMVFAPDGRVLATGADDGTVRLWDPRTGKELARIDVPAPVAAAPR